MPVKSDKVWHFMTFFGGTVAITLLLSQYISIIPATIIMIILGVGAGLVKEFKIDEKPDLIDLSTNFGAMGLGFLVVLIAYITGVVPE